MKQNNDKMQNFMHEIYEELDAVCFIDILLNHTSIGQFIKFNYDFKIIIFFLDSEW